MPVDRLDPAPLPLRWAAGLVDLILLGAVGNLAGLTVLELAGARGGWGTVGLAVLVVLATAAAYFAAGEGRWGTTLGKLAVGIRVVAGDGRPPGFRRALGRFAVRLVGTALLGAGWWPALVGSPRERGRTWHDAVAGTRAVRWRPWQQATGAAAR
ncbi:RDD domain containing protein [Thermaerobacter marianensis DSM 12885]|uniref:RDD domain containing protein n=1 Tax=Thermaerobacter marianensis (strain ATCC 700841 / DSM 12885 / JCM 10246 / 7p75a) TaxID=644966 RepID=E6SL18_THEM7|nr:RDD family protein [Thermaerobacter marianensis]ADU50220.1 RDD domain containing protein [Thermaerobacter marianensis DSM 12885]